ncbi:MAG TPA: beta-eliminating lyase-related protein [Thermoanaerobaculia bacterium]|nr:beta-eliminating lyase-related protein [Thermoanaerobaculia bacterium]
MRDFRSDNILPGAPEILDAVVRANAGTTTSYGGDEITARVRRQCCEIFETEVEVFPILSGIAGNALAIAALAAPWGAVFCHAQAHIEREELGAATFFSGGAKLVPIDGAEGKLQPAAVAAALAYARKTDMALPACLSVTNATEAGTVYSVSELRTLGDLAREANLRVHMDGARFANAVAATGASPADLSWRAGVDALSFGATKNGAMTADMIVLFRTELAEELSIRIHRSGHRPSKMRFLSAQLEAYLRDDLWLRNARHANRMAARLAAGIAPHVVNGVDANIVFVRFPPARAERLRGEGFLFSAWPIFGDDVYRLVTGWATTEADVDALVAIVQ